MVASTGRSSTYWKRGNALSIFPESNEQALQMKDDRNRHAIMEPRNQLVGLRSQDCECLQEFLVSSPLLFVP